MSGSANRRSKTSGNDDEKQLEPEMLAGRRWGFSDSGASIGFEREVRVDVQPDQIIIADKYPIPVEPGNSKQELFEQFATALDRYSHEWGRPPQGFFWTPRLKFVVKPEASSVYEQVSSMLKRAGMSTSHEFAKGASKADIIRDTFSPAKPSAKSANGNPTTGGSR
jgi:hypothetical protein